LIKLINKGYLYMLKLIKFEIGQIYKDKNNINSYKILDNKEEYIETENQFGIKKHFGKTLMNNIETAYDFEMNPFLYSGIQKKEDLDFQIISKRKNRKEMSKLHSEKINFNINFNEIYKTL